MSAALKKLKKDIEHTSMMKFAPASEAELKALGSVPDGYVAGWASTPDVDSYHHIVAPGAFDDAIKARGINGPRGIKLLIGHEWSKLAGRIIALENRAERLWIEAQLNLEITYVKDAYLAMKDVGGINFSVGFMLQDWEYKELPSGVEVLQINRGDLYEVSAVPFPGNEECTMDFIKAKLSPPEISSIADFEKHLVATGVATSRNDARKITQEVKSFAHLFVKTGGSAPVVSPLPPSDTPPVLADDQHQAIKEMIAGMVKTLDS